MVQRGDGPGLAVEAGQGRRILGLIGGQHLERDLPPELEMLAEIDRADAAGADAVEDEIFADEEPRPPAAHQVVGLERREEAVADEEGRQIARSTRQRSGLAQAGDIDRQPGRVQRQALLDQIEQVVGGGCAAIATTPETNGSASRARSGAHGATLGNWIAVSSLAAADGGCKDQPDGIRRRAESAYCGVPVRAPLRSPTVASPRVGLRPSVFFSSPVFRE